MRLTGILFFCTLLLFLPANSQGSDVEFDRVNGSDLIMGIGARAIGMGGAFVAVSDDATAIFWNPAGLTRLPGSQLHLSAYVPSDFSAAAIIYRPDAAALKKYRFTVGLGLINRLDFKGDSGEGTWEGFPSHLLDLAMIDVGDDFSGSVESKTRDVRLSLSMVPGNLRDLSVGVSLIHIS
jgi:hypothetical protein